ncbi:DUF6412 domain-containing protein [Streptosporangium roseum]|uniref:Uncharacterized protein n=1 Tax=Streptosporangium roseum (strain ATCC 12428 / DSM 43021 / JCM 3005 / KCTC 9067 / NCIMB 10171 / NRRL 2505 / NI 9100) TaxID=479432 RepID=D2AXK4_STRRD|nr:DUF6412 domain-containing protein [Streptosporangium roseum]ACZ83184.1 hypothetical protein Sros_0130 [Streptosporangium roseum DSM 43021]
MSVLLALQTLSVWMFDGGGAVTATAVVGLGVLLLAWALRALPLTSEAGPRSALSRRDRARQTMFVRQRDPDAAGRSRPRAPSPGPAPA